MGKSAGLDLAYLKQVVTETNEKRKEFSSGSDIVWFNFEQGSNMFRILPSWRDKNGKEPLTFAMPVYKHKLPDPIDNYTCVDKTWPELGIPCPVCVALKTIKENDIAPPGWLAGRAYCNVIDKMGRDTEVQVCGLPMGTFNWLCEQAIAVDGSGDHIFGDFTDMDEGFNVLVSRSGKMKKTKYSPSFAGQAPVAESPEKAKLILDSRFDLDNIWPTPDDAYIAQGKEIAADLLRSVGLTGPLTTSSKTPTDEKSSSKKSSPEPIHDDPVAQAISKKLSEDSDAEVSSVGVEKADNVPPGAPDCYATASTDNHYLHLPKCAVCIFDDACYEATESDPHKESLRVQVAASA